MSETEQPSAGFTHTGRDAVDPPSPPPEGDVVVSCVDPLNDIAGAIPNERLHLNEWKQLGKYEFACDPHRHIASTLVNDLSDHVWIEEERVQGAIECRSAEYLGEGEALNHINAETGLYELSKALVQEHKRGMDTLEGERRGVDPPFGEGIEDECDLVGCPMIAVGRTVYPWTRKVA